MATYIGSDVNGHHQTPCTSRTEDTELQLSSSLGRLSWLMGSHCASGLPVPLCTATSFAISPVCSGDDPRARVAMMARSNIKPGGKSGKAIVRKAEKNGKGAKKAKPKGSISKKTVKHGVKPKIAMEPCTVAPHLLLMEDDGVMEGDLQRVDPGVVLEDDVKDEYEAIFSGVNWKVAGEGKPPHSYATLIHMAIMRHNNKASLGQIYDYIRFNFMYYRNSTETGWKNSIRHNLTHHNCFAKVERAADEPGKGGFWEIDSEHASRMFRHGIFRRKQRRSQKAVTSASMTKRKGASPKATARGKPYDGARRVSSRTVAATEEEEQQAAPGLDAPGLDASSFSMADHRFGVDQRPALFNGLTWSGLLEDVRSSDVLSQSGSISPPHSRPPPDVLNASTRSSSSLINALAQADMDDAGAMTELRSSARIELGSSSDGLLLSQPFKLSLGSDEVAAFVDPNHSLTMADIQMSLNDTVRDVLDDPSLPQSTGDDLMIVGVGLMPGATSELRDVYVESGSPGSGCGEEESSAGTQEHTMDGIGFVQCGAVAALPKDGNVEGAAAIHSLSPGRSTTAAEVVEMLSRPGAVATPNGSMSEESLTCALKADSLAPLNGVSTLA